MPDQDKVWDAGQRMAVAYRHRHSYHELGVIDIQMPKRAGADLALALMKLKQTTMLLPASIGELLHALNFVLVGDPASVAAHKAMEAGKGMEPAAGDPRSYAASGPGHPFRQPTSPQLPKDKCVHSADGKAHTLCWRPREEHLS
jgi:hypothetical protein